MPALSSSTRSCVPAPGCGFSRRVASCSAFPAKRPGGCRRWQESIRRVRTGRMTRWSAPSFTVTKRNALVLARVCQRLDGIPLAIELAAARLAALGVDQVVARLDDRFRLLTGGSRTKTRRHQTL